MKFSKLLIAICLFFSIIGNAQNWGHLTFNANQPGLELNPLKGFATMFNPSNNFPRSIQGKLFGLDDIMTGMNNFNWTPIDDFLTQQASEGRHSYLQVNIDPAFGNSDMPTFLTNQVAWQYHNGGGVPDLCPDWNDPELMAAMLNFIDAFGARYNNDSRAFLVHLGLYGMWGEWHIGDVVNVKPDFEMTEANKTLIANAYKNAFPDKLLLARYPENMPDPQKYGYSDGLFFGQSISNSNPFYFNNTIKTYNAYKNWMLYPIGGEIDPDLQTTIFDVLPNSGGQDVLQCLDLIHPTWLFSHHILTVAQPNTTEWDNAIMVQKAMGYTFYIDKYRLSASNGKPTIEINIQNKGIAPMYANWDLEFGVLNSTNQFISLGFQKLNLNLIQPDVLNNYRSFASNRTLIDGTYKFMLRVINPLEANSVQAKPVRFANTTQDEDREGWITLGEQTIASGSSGVAPIKVTGISLTPSTHTMQVGQTLQLSPIILPINATNSAITYVSDHPGTALVSENGLITSGPSYGPVIISVYTQDGSFVGQSQINVQPVRVNIPAVIQAEDFIKMSGVTVENSSEGGSNLGYINTNDWMDYAINVNSSANFSVDFRVASPSGGGEISLLDEAGNNLGTIQVPATGGWQTYNNVSLNSISLPAGGNIVRVQAKIGGFNLNWIEFKSQTALPINLQNIKAIPNNDHIIIEWTASFESNNEGFYLERSIYNQAFNKITWVAGKKLSNELNKYSFTDSNVVKNVNYYYRLAQQDFDKTVSYSKIISAKLNQIESDFSNQISLFPNPTPNRFKINWESAAFDIRLSDLAFFNTFGANVTPIINSDRIIDLSHLPYGMYYMVVVVKGEKVTKKIVKN